MKGLIRMLAASVAATGLSACGSDPPPEPRAQPAIAVTITPVIPIETADQLEAGGIVAARQSASVSSRIVASVAGVQVNAGDRVRAGQVLLTLDAQDVTRQTGQARANAVAAEKALARARTEHAAAEAEHGLASAWRNRIVALHTRHSSTDQERDEAEARLSAATARHAGSRLAIEGAEAQLDSARAAVGVTAATASFAALRSPYDGLVTERLIDPGNLAAPGVPLLRVESDGVRHVVTRVDEARAAYVHPGDRVRVLIEAAEERPEADNGVEGVVSEVARAIGADQRAFTVKVTVPGTVTARSGSFARVVFRGARRHALIVPADAIQQHGQVSSVYVVQGDIARLRLVQVGAVLSEGVEVLAGLDARESVVTSSLARLADGATVTVGGAPPRTGGAP